MARVYLETSFIGACVTSRTDAGSVYRREVSNRWLSNESASHTLYVSDEVVEELDAPTFADRDSALALIKQIPVLSVVPEVTGFASMLVKEKVMPGPIAGDAIHVATSVLYGMDYVLTWNVKHLANPNKTRHLATICFRIGMSPPQIITPDLLWEVHDDTT